MGKDHGEDERGAKVPRRRTLVDAIYKADSSLGSQGKDRRGLAKFSTRTLSGTPGSALPRPFLHLPVPVMMTRAQECWSAWTDLFLRRAAGGPATRPDLPAVGRAVTVGCRPSNRPSLVIRH